MTSTIESLLRLAVYSNHTLANGLVISVSIGRLNALSPQGPEALLQSILLLGGGLVGLGLEGLGAGGLGGVELGVELDAGVIGELSEKLMDGVVGDLLGGGLGDGILVDAVVDGVLLVLLAELLEGEQGTLGVRAALGGAHDAR